MEVSGQKCRARVQAEPQRDGQKGVGGGRRGRGTANGSGHGATHVAAALGRLAVHKDDLDHLEALLDHLERQGLAQLDLDCREYAACFSDVDAKVAMDLDRKGRYSMQDIRAALDATKAAAFLYREHCSSLSFHSRVKRRRARVQDHLYLQHAAARPNSSQPAAVLPEDAANTAPFGASEPGTARQDRSALPMVVKVRSRSQHAEEAGARLTATLQAAGFDAASSAAAVKATGGDAESALAVLCQRSYARNDLSVDRGNEPFREQVRAGLADLGHAPADSSTDAIQRALREVVDEELMAMSAILGEDAIAGAEPGSEGVELSWRGEDDGTDVLAGASLVLQLPSGCAYPFRPPAAVLVRHTAASFRDRAALSAAARAEAQRLCCGEPCLHSLMQHLQDNATDIIAAARDAEAAPVQGSGRAGGLDGGNAGEAGTEGGVRQAGSKCGEQDQLGEEQQADEDADDEGEGEGGEEMWRDGEEGDVMEEEEEEEEEEDEEGELAAASRYGPGAAVEEERRREASQQLEMRKRLEDAHAKELAEGAELQSKELLQKLQVWRTSRSGGVPAMRKQRQKLPAWAQAERVVSTVLKEQVSIICGETGCGKTTQVPQFILDHAIEQQRGGYVNMLCTQPRRISATSVAERVAAERGEKLGETVGYSIRLETVRSAKTRLLLCTTGVLLRRLVSDPFLVGVSHVIVDEVHERSLDSDFLLVLLRQLLPQRPDLRLVLMSATVNSQLFRDYFGGAPVLTIPGFTHPVTEHYLENLLEWTKFRPEPAPNSQRRDRPSPEEEQWLKGLAGRGFSSATLATLRTLNQDAVNPSLAFAALKWVLKQGGNEAGAVLVFLPGLMEIEQLHRLCRSDPQVVQATGSGRYLLALHSSLSGPEQSKVFEQPKAGARKVVLATNIAETSITIDDVVWVIDSGRVKEVQYNADSHLQLLVECWTSRASARQRRGRAGRVQPGQCLRLFSSFVHDAVMQQEQAPEMLRVPLEGLCLQIRQLRLQGGLEGFLAAALQPPSPTAISAAITSLKQIGALDEGDELTPLGCHLAGMPLDVRIGKMLLFATMLGCLEPALSCAAVMSCASNPFYSPIDQRDAADEARRTFADGGSDVLTAVRAFREWQQVQKQGFAAERAWCRQNFVSGHNMAIIADLRRHLRQVLRDAGFLGGAWRSLSNRHAADQRLLKAMLVAGLYPNLAKQVGWQKGPPVRPLLKARAHDGQAAQMVDLHPASINAVLDDLPSKLLVYHEKVKSKSLLLRDSTTVTALPLVLFGGPLLVQHHAGQLMVGGEFLTLACSMRAALTLRRLRLQLDLLLQDMLGDRVDLAGRLEERCTLLVDAIVRVLDREKPLQMCTQ